MQRKIPATMATQHPDNAGKAFWLNRRYVDTRDEVKECFVSFSELGCEEFMWDWEGKYVDEAVVDRLLEDYFFFFSEHPLGRDVFLTFRLPNIWQEKGYRIARALVGMITANDIAHDLGMHEPALFEAILPMTDDAKKLVFIQKHYRELALAFKKLGHVCAESMRIIPLIEDMRSMAGAEALLADYCSLHKKEFGCDVDYMRPFIARSDPALNYGMVAAVLGAKIALHNIGAAAERLQVQMHPIIGVGSLPFRGHLAPGNVANYLREYAGIRTTTVQSALRYDYPPAEAKKAIKALNEGQNRRARMLDDDERRSIMQLIGTFTRNYQRTIERLSEYINAFSERIPNRRERRVHAGLFGYSRSVAGKRLPRAIPFVATMYSLGCLPSSLARAGRCAKRKNYTCLTHCSTPTRASKATLRKRDTTTTGTT